MAIVIVLIFFSDPCCGILKHIIIFINNNKTMYPSDVKIHHPISSDILTECSIVNSDTKT